MTVKHDLLHTTDFECGEYPFPDFTLRADQLKFGDHVVNNVNILAQYNRHMQLTLTYKGDAENLKILQDCESITLIGVDYPESVDLISTRKTIKCSYTEVILTPSREPLLIDFGHSATEIEAVIMNGPETRWSGKELCFEAGDYQLRLSEFQDTKKLRNQQKNLTREYVATGKITLKRNDNAPIAPDVAFRKLAHFDSFLTFVRGAHCGIGNIIGRSVDGGDAFAYLGFLRIDQFKVTTGWCDLGVVKSLPEIYGLYTTAVADENDKKPLLTTIEFYRAANVTRETSLEMAIIASHAALETIVPHLLKSKAGWSTNLLKNREISFHDKLRAAINYVGLSANPFEHLVDLQAKSKGLNADAYEIVSIFRNRIVHQSKPFSYNGIELMQAWSLSQWLCEIFLFSWFNYRGDMNDRRKFTGWRGEAIKPVPLNR